MIPITNEEVIEAFDILEAIGTDPSILSKRANLKRGANNAAFCMILLYTYDPSKIFYIKQQPEVEEIHNVYPMSMNFRLFFSLLDSLCRRLATGAAARSNLEELFARMSPEERGWYTGVLKKDLNIGIKSTLINQEIPGLIPVFQVQLAKEFDGRLPRKILLEPKLDGYRCLGHTTTGKLFSRNGKPIEGYETLEAELRLLPQGLQLDCEIMSTDFKGTQTQAFRKSSGKSGVLVAFDLIDDVGALENNPNIQRYEELKKVVLNTPDSITPHIKRIVSTLIEGETDVQRMAKMSLVYETVINKGYEGLMIKDALAPYERRRGTNWQKFKPVNSVDLVVIDIEPGEKLGKYEDVVGRIVVDFEGNEVRVGSGISDKERVMWWNNPEEIIGKTVEILYQNISTNQSGGRSLRFPRLKCIRTDK